MSDGQPGPLLPEWTRDLAGLDWLRIEGSMRRTVLLAIGFAAVLLNVPFAAVAGPVITAVLPMAASGQNSAVEKVYYYHGRYYPYRYHGGYYRHRYYRHGYWHYY